MSTIRATNLKNASSTTNNAVMTAGGDFTNAAGISYMGGNKNLLINGAMQVHQRGASTASITTSGYYTADRWLLGLGSLGTWTNSIENDAPTGSGFRKSLKVLCTTAETTLGGTRFLAFEQRLEGQDLQRIAKGTSSAQQLTLSFWVKSNVTGAYIADLRDNDNTRHVSASYTISASATWERKTITFPADTTGAFDNDNALSFTLTMWLGAGTDFTSGTLNTAWASQVNANRAVGQTNLAAATNNYWQITGVQLEVGPVATSFEFEPYETTLRKCQRYYQVIGKITDTPLLMGAAHSSSVARGSIIFTEMRTAPTTVTFPAMIGLNASNGSAGTATMTASAVTSTSLYYTGTGMTGLTAGNATIFQTADSNGLRLSAEL